MRKVKLALAIQDNLQNDLKQRVISDGYGMRGKSKWVAEAITNLLSTKNFPELVSYSDEMQGFDKIDTLVIEPELKRELEHAVLLIRKQFPVMEGVVSRIIRTAILQRLLRSTTANQAKKALTQVT